MTDKVVSDLRDEVAALRLENQRLRARLDRGDNAQMMVEHPVGGGWPADGSSVMSLDEREQLLDMVLDAIEDCVHILSPDLTILRANKWMRRKHEQRGALVGRKCYEACEGRTTPCPDCPCLKALATGLLTRDIVAGNGPEDEPRWLELTAYPLKTPSGQVLGVLEYTKDVTARIEAEASLRMSERKLSNAMQIARLGYWEYDVETNLFTFDDLFYAIFRTSAEEVGGYTMSPEDYARRFLHPDDIPLVAEENKKALETADPHFSRQLEHRIIYADGEIGTIAVRYFIVKDEHGRTIKTYGANQDITDRKHYEDELRAAEQRAVAASHAKSEFLANMSHEIRTPMTAILGYADVLLEQHRDGDDGQGRSAAVHTIKRNGQYLLELINGILDLSKIEAGKFDVVRVPCSPCLMIADVASLMRVRADQKGIALNVEYGGPIPETITTDPTGLRQILLNMLGNAIKFTEEGSVTLRTSLDKAGTTLVCDVIDTGIGMSSPAMANLFRPFTQIDMSSARRFGGTGLGLMISRRLAQLLGGDVAIVESAMGAGTHFRISVSTGPLVGVALLDDPLAATTITPAPRKLPIDALPKDALAGCSILLAEDGEDNQRLITHVLRRHGARVVIGENGQVAVDLALGALHDGVPFDVVLMDMQMPVMDGYAATRKLRSLGYTGPIIALTANAMDHDRAKCLESGCDDYTTKPIDQVALIRLLQARTTTSDPVAPA